MPVNYILFEHNEYAEFYPVEYHPAPASELDKMVDISNHFASRLRTKEQNASSLPSNVRIKQPVKINLELLEELDNSPEFCSPSFINKALTYLVVIIRSRSVAISFREVFLIPDGAVPPKAYRPEIDVRTRSLREYQEKTNKFSYQLLKLMFNTMAYKAPSRWTSSSNRDYHTKNIGALIPLSYNDLSPTLNELPYFPTVAEARNYLKHYKVSMEKNKRLILAFAPTVRISDLAHILKTKHNELIIILEGQHYQKPEERKRFYKKMLKLIDASKCRSLLHVFLIPQRTVQHNLSELAPDPKNKKGAFSALAHNAGYYLSAPEVFARIFRHIQDINVNSIWFDRTLKNAQYTAQTKSKSTAGSAYIIYGKEETGDFRQSKRFTPKKLKAQVAFAHSQQQELSQNQQQSQAQQQNQQQTLAQAIDLDQNLQQSIHHSSTWNWTVSFNSFCGQLKARAEAKLRDQRKLKQDLELMYLTRYYREHHSESHLIRRIATDENFRTSLAAKIFSMAPTPFNKDKNNFIKIPNYSVDSISSACADDLISHVNYLLDGMNPDYRVITQGGFFGGERSLYKMKDCAWGHSRPYFNERFDEPFSSLALLSQNGSSAYQSHLQYAALLPEKDLAPLTKEERSKLIQHAETLLALFTQVATKESIAEKEASFFALMQFYFGKNPEYINRLERLFAVFELHDEDNLKILTQIMLTGHKAMMEDFLKLLAIIEHHSLLKHFYKIYFKYAANIFSVVSLLKEINYWSGLETGKKTGRWSSVGDLQLFRHYLTRLSLSEKFQAPEFHKIFPHALIFAAKSNHQINLHDAEIFWRRIWVKIQAYVNHNEQEAHTIMERLCAHLLNDEGFSLAPVSSDVALYGGLENLIDHAITQGCLHEQVTEIAGISFAWMDVPYAISNNHFQVVCSEMLLVAPAIDPQTKRYSVSLKELREALKKHQPGSNWLKTAVFRFLGGERFREELTYYRNLYDWLKKTAHNEENAHLKELLIAYYVSATTGTNHGLPINQKLFTDEFIGILRHQGIVGLNFSKELDEFFQLLPQTPTDVQKGVASLWTIWQQQKTPVLAHKDQEAPEILALKFEHGQLKSFLLKNRAALKVCAPKLSPSPELPFSLIKNWFSKTSEVPFEQHSLILLKVIYPKLSLNAFLDDLFKIIQLTESFSIAAQRGAHQKTYTVLQQIITKHPNIDQALELIDLVASEIADKRQDEPCAQFLEALASQNNLLIQINTVKPLLALILNFGIKLNLKTTSYPLLFNFCTSLLPLGVEQAAPILKRLLTSMGSKEGYQFFNENPKLSAQQIDQITQSIEQVDAPSISIPFLQLCLQNERQIDLGSIQKLLKDMNPESTQQQLLILNVAWVERSVTRVPGDQHNHENPGYAALHPGYKSIFELLEQLKKLPPNQLEQLVRLHELYALQGPGLVALLASPSLPDAIAAFERDQHAKNWQRYEYKPEEVLAKIAAIKHKTPTGKDGALPPKAQARLLKDYEKVMSYMTQKTILIEQDSKGIKRAFTISQLSQAQFQILFKKLIERINKGDQKHEHQLMILALACEALYRTRKTFPRNIQILDVLNDLHQNRDSIHEVPTGQGKSIIDALSALTLYDGKRSIEIATENAQLARDGLKKFAPMFRYLGVQCAAQIIEAHSPHKTYKPGGIHYSTPSDLALFRAQMKLEKKPLPKNVALICDEIDAVLTSLVQFRLAATLNSTQQDTQSWTAVYQCLLKFVQEKDIFLQNKCSKDEDVDNFINYFIAKHRKKRLVDFVSQLSKPLISTLIDSALIANALEENVDYRVLQKTVGDKTLPYAAPIIDSTNRPDVRVSYMASVQQLLHTKLNQAQPAPVHSFPMEPVSDTLLVVSAKNFFDFYRLNGERTIGLTGTAGISIELQEFFKNHGLSAFSYPSFHENNGEDLGIIPALGRETQFSTILKTLQEHKKSEPTQPILLITESPSVTIELANYLATHEQWKTQTFHGHDQDGLSESSVIQIVGQDEILTIANKSLTRGADPKPQHPKGLFVINTCDELTASELRQIKGRQGRDGKPGLFCSIIDVSKFATADSKPEEIAAAFLAYQQKLSEQKQKQRLKTRLLEESRSLIIHKYLLELREQADKILNKQFGLYNDLVSTQDLMKALSELNQGAERHFAQLLEKHSEVEGAAAEEFLEARIKEYQQVLDRWLPEERFKNFHPIEPLIPLEHLQALAAQSKSVKIKDLTLLSELFSKGWEHVGHQKMQHYFAKANEQIRILEPYYKKEQSLQHVLAESALAQGLVDQATLITGIEAFSKYSTEFLEQATKIPVVGSLIPADKLTAFSSTYFEALKTQVKEKRWGDLTLPQIDYSTIGTWWSRVNTALTIGSIVFGGPVPFIINRIVIPTLLGWLPSLFKDSFASSDSSYLQVIAGLTDISTDLNNAFNTFVDLYNGKAMTVGIFLDQVAPLLKNKALQSLIIKYFELNQQEHLIPFVHGLPEFLKTLDPYREKQVQGLLNTETLITLLYKTSQFEQVKKCVENSEVKAILARLPGLSPELLSSMSALNLQELLGLTQVIAHPEFYNFVKVLPPTATLPDLLKWLAAKPETVPVEIRTALTEFQAYQTNRERIEATTREQMLSLKKQFSLSKDQLKGELAGIAPKTQEALVPERVSSINFLKIGAAAVSLSLLILYTAFFFTMTILAISMLVASITLYPIIKDEIIPLFKAKESPPDKKPVEPVLVFTSELEQQPEKPAEEPVKEFIRSLGLERHTGTLERYGFFKQKEEAPIVQTIPTPIAGAV